MTTICVGVTDCTEPSFTTPPPRSKRTLTGAVKFVPLTVTTSPPVGLPMFGETLLMVGAVEGGGPGGTASALKGTSMLLATLFTVAVTVMVPTSVEVMTAEATPLVVVLMILMSPFSVNVAAVLLEVNSTAVPFGAAAPLTVTVAVMVETELTTGLAFDEVSVTVAPV